MKKKSLGISDLLTSKRELILAAIQRHGAFNVRVFGSVARGEADDESDIDFLIDVSDTWGMDEYHALKIALEAIIGRKVDIAPSHTLREVVKNDILRDAVEL